METYKHREVRAAYEVALRGPDRYFAIVGVSTSTAV
jgi:hypothetical protein